MLRDPANYPNGWDPSRWRQSESHEAAVLGGDYFIREDENIQQPLQESFLRTIFSTTPNGIWAQERSYNALTPLPGHRLANGTSLGSKPDVFSRPGSPIHPTSRVSLLSRLPLHDIPSSSRPKLRIFQSFNSTNTLQG
jgi:hypothetical protein